MKKLLPKLLLVCAAAMTGLHLEHHSFAKQAGSQTGAEASSGAAPEPASVGSTADPQAAPLPIPAAGNAETPPATNAAAGSNSPPALSMQDLLGQPPSQLAPATVLRNMRAAVRLYGSMLGGNPVGTNLEITRALNGANSKRARFVRSEAGLRVNAKGELMDPWGTPFFFHQLSATEMEIRSAGPDRTMGTADDLVVK